MEVFYITIKVIHIVAGSLALLCGVFAILFRNKIKWHRPFGLIYFYCMTIIFASSTFMSIYRSNIFLLCVGFFTYYSAITAYRSLKLKKLHLDQKPEKIDWVIEIVFGVTHVAFVTYAIVLLVKGHQAAGIISLVFGLIGLRGNQTTIKRLNKKLEYKNYWLLAHIGGMLGSYIGALTAFLVNNGRLVPLPNVMLWLGPTIIFVPLIFFEIARHKRKSNRINP